VSAPGENILSSCRPYLIICAQGKQFENGPGPLDIGTYNVISGTSMVTPQLTGIVAQLFQANPNATPAEIENAIKSTADKYSDVPPTSPSDPARPATTRAPASSTPWPPLAGSGRRLGPSGALARPKPSCQGPGIRKRLRLLRFVWPNG
jgi:subtilisin family serine protease